MCWAEIAKGVVYLLNCSPLGKDSKLAYKRLRHEKPYIGHLKVLGCRAWVYIPKEKYTKLDERTWQGILVSYKGTNQYRILDPCTGKVHVTCDVHFNKKNIYDCKGLTPRNFEEEEWAPNDDDLFMDPTTFVSNEDTPDPWDLPIPKPAPHSIYFTPLATPLGGDNGDNDDDNEEEPGIFENMEYATRGELTIQGE